MYDACFPAIKSVKCKAKLSAHKKSIKKFFNYNDGAMHSQS